VIRPAENAVAQLRAQLTPPHNSLGESGVAEPRSGTGHSRRFVPMASASAEGQLSDLLDPDKLVSWVPEAAIQQSALRIRGWADLNSGDADYSGQRFIAATSAHVGLRPWEHLEKLAKANNIAQELHADRAFTSSLSCRTISVVLRISGSLKATPMVEAIERSRALSSR